MRALLVLLVACGSSKPAKPDVDATRAIEALTSWADRCVACNNDKGCAQLLRDDFDKYKRGLFESRPLYTPAEGQAFDAQFQRFGMCGDAAGLTIWSH